MIDREKCLYYHDGPCHNPKGCREGHKVIDQKTHKATCSSNGVVFLRSLETLYHESGREPR